MEIDFLGKWIAYNPEDRTIVIQTNFLDPDTQRDIERAVVEQRTTKIKSTIHFRKTKHDQHRRAWYGGIALIMKSDQYQLEPFAENLADLDDYLRETIFPVLRKNILGKEIPSVARMRHLSDEEMERCINTLFNRYSYLTINDKPIDFSDLKVIK